MSHRDSDCSDKFMYRSDAFLLETGTWYCRVKVFFFLPQSINSNQLKVKLSPKCNRGSFCECTQVEPSFESIIMTKALLLSLSVFSFLGPNNFQWSAWSKSYVSNAIFKTLRSLDTTWNFARSITRVSTHEHGHWEHCLCTQSLLKRKFWNNSR